MCPRETSTLQVGFHVTKQSIKRNKYRSVVAKKKILPQVGVFYFEGAKVFKTPSSAHATVFN